MEINKIYNEDCLTWMSRFQGKVDIVLTSPPYNTGGRIEYWSSKKIKGKRVYSQEKRYDEYTDTKTSEQYVEWSIDLFNSYDKVLKQDGVVLYNISYGNEEQQTLWLLIAEIIKSTNFTVADCITWKKQSAIPNTSSKNKLTRICEFCFVFVRKDEYLTFNSNKNIVSTSPKGQDFYEVFYNFIEAPNNDSSTPLNKATFSTGFARKLLSMYAKPKSLVYDSFMGTGTTANACIIDGHNYLGTELSKAQCDFAENRLQNYLKQQKLF